MKKNNDSNLKNNLKKLSEISNWFDNLKEVDIEEGIAKAKESSELIKSAKKRLGEIENEFEEIKKEIKDEK